MFAYAHTKHFIYIYIYEHLHICEMYNSSGTGIRGGEQTGKALLL